LHATGGSQLCIEAVKISSIAGLLAERFKPSKLVQPLPAFYLDLQSMLVKK